MENYMHYHVMGSVSQVRMRTGCFPTKFECEPDRKKQTCDKDLAEKSKRTKHPEQATTSSGNSGTN